MPGSHCLKTHSQTQDTIAMSSGESEFYGWSRGGDHEHRDQEFDGGSGLARGDSSEYGFKCYAEHLIKKRCWASSTCEGALAVGTGECPRRRVVRYQNEWRRQRGRRLGQTCRPEQTGDIHGRVFVDIPFAMGYMSCAPTLDMFKFFNRLVKFVFTFVATMADQPWNCPGSVSDLSRIQLDQLEG
jgi:hypothetical protein